MAIYRQAADGQFVPFESTPFPDLEKKLEDWIELNPHLLLDGEPLAVIARQPRNEHGKFLDLLAVDRTGATVVVELKRGEAPRDVLAQAFEYAAWVDSLSFDQLDELGREYAARRGIDAAGLHDLYSRVFGEDGPDEAPVDPAVVTFNSRQRIVVVAESFTPEVLQTARYFRSRMSADVHAVKFLVHRAGSETVLETSAVVGQEPVRAAAVPREQPQTDDEYRLSVATDFMRAASTLRTGPH
ncbi:MAG: hypothetical protein AB7P22_20335 [Vicinamibacterales bacterium]